MKLYLYILGIMYWIAEHLAIIIGILSTLIALLCVLLYSCFSIQTYDIAVYAGTMAVLTWAVILSSAVSDRMMLWLVPEDEEV